MSNYVEFQDTKAHESLIPTRSKAFEDFQEWKIKDLLNSVDIGVLPIYVFQYDIVGNRIQYYLDQGKITHDLSSI